MTHLAHKGVSCNTAAMKPNCIALAHDATETTPTDPRLIFLERASARLILVEALVIDLDEAFGGLIDAFNAIAPCQCDRHHREVQMRRIWRGAR
jgi:hypothetical protein